MAHEIDISNDRVNMAYSGEKPSSPETPEDRYARGLDDMLLDAADCQSLEVLTDTLTLGLAVIATQGGIEVTGDIVLRLGGHIRRIAERNRAKAEAEEFRQKGVAFQ
jgi:hypothetical protein